MRPAISLFICNNRKNCALLVELFDNCKTNNYTHPPRLPIPSLQMIASVTIANYQLGKNKQFVNKEKNNN